MPDRWLEDAEAEIQLKRDWEPKGWDTGRVNGEWWALHLASGEPLGPATTPADLDAMLQALEDSETP